MRQNDKIVPYVLCVCLLVYTLVYRFFIAKYVLEYSEYISASFILIIAFIGCALFGWRKDTTNSLKKAIFFKTIVMILIYFSVFYLLGVFMGFKWNAYSLKPVYVFRNVLCPLILYTCLEIFRYVLLNHFGKHRQVISFMTFTLCAFEILVTARLPKGAEFVNLFQFGTSKVFPIICKNIVLTSLVRDGGIRTTLVYRLLLDLYIFFVPIVPDVGDYISSMLGISFPILLYILVQSDMEKYYRDKEKKEFKNQLSLIDIGTIAVGCVLVALLSGFFPITMIAVGSNSMMPKIAKGDAVVYLRVTSPDSLKEGDILVYQTDDSERIIIHRLLSIENDGDETHYVTKGDANTKEDKIDVLYHEIKGKVLFKIKYIAYPTILINDFINQS